MRGCAKGLALLLHETVSCQGRRIADPRVLALQPAK